jgi:hypothetical protein
MKVQNLKLARALIAGVVFDTVEAAALLTSIASQPTFIDRCSRCKFKCEATLC